MGDPAGHAGRPTEPLYDADSAAAALELVGAAAPAYLSTLADRSVSEPGARELLGALDRPLPEHGYGAVASTEELLRIGTRAATHSSGPRFFHFVIGGTTPAAMAGDWTASLLDQCAGLWTSSPLAATVETVTLRWLRDLFGLPAAWSGVLTPSATFANLTGLAAARQWWGKRHGVDVAADGLAGLPPMPVHASGYVQPQRPQGTAHARLRPRRCDGPCPRRGRPARSGLAGTRARHRSGSQRPRRQRR